MDPVHLPSGYGFRVPHKGELTDRGILETLTVWEPPRKQGKRRYYLGVDVSDGLQQDRSVIQVVREATLEEPAEQVAEYVSDQMLPAGLAYVVQAVGMWYQDDDGVEAMAAIETNNHGLTTQDTLQLHLGYGHFYTWEYLDAANAEGRFSTRIGWYTNPRTRAALLTKLRDAICTVDKITGFPDLVTHSPYLHDEFKDFQTQGAIFEAAAARGAYDDRVMALAIAYYVSFRRQAGESEPIDDRRRRKHEQAAVIAAAAEPGTQKPDWRNTAAGSDEIGVAEDEIDHDIMSWGSY